MNLQMFVARERRSGLNFQKPARLWGLLVVGAVTVPRIVGCGGAMDDNQRATRTLSTGGAAQAGNAGTHQGVAAEAHESTAGSGSLGTADWSGAAGATEREGGAIAGAAGSDPCGGPCQGGRVCRKLEQSYRCVTRTCGPTRIASLDGVSDDVAIGDSRIYSASGKVLYIYSLDGEKSGSILGQVSLATDIDLILLAGDQAYLRLVDDSLAIVDVKQASVPRLRSITPLDTGAFPQGHCAHDTMAVANGFVYAVGSSGLWAIDVRDPEKPLASGRVALAGTAVALYGQFAYVAGQTDGLWVIGLNQPNQPQLIRQLPGTDVRDVAIYDRYLYVTNMTPALDVYELSEPANPTYVTPAVAPLLYDGSNCSVEVTDGIVFTNRNIRWDLSDPATPKHIRRFAPGGYGEIAKSGKVTVAAAGERGIAVLDLDAMAERFTYNSLRRSGPLAIGAGHAYVLTDQSLEVVDLRHPQDPKLVGDLSGAFTDVTWQGNRVLLASTSPGLSVVDVSDPAHPVVVTSLAVPGGASCLRVDGATAYLCAGDGTQGLGRLQIVDLTDPERPTLRGELPVPSGVKSIDSAANIVHLVDGTGNFIVVDATLRDQPILLSSQSVPNAMAVRLHGTHALVGATNLEVFDVALPSSPVHLTTVEMPERVRSLAIAGDRAAVLACKSCTNASLVSLDLSAIPTAIRAMDFSLSATDGRVYRDGSATAVALDANAVALVAGESGLRIYDLGSPIDEQVEGALTLAGGGCHAFAVQGAYGYVVEGANHTDAGTSTLRVIDLSDLAHMSVIGSLEVPVPGMGLTYDLLARGKRAYLLTGDRGLMELDMSIPSAPAVVGNLSMTGSAMAMDVTESGDIAYVLSQETISVVSVGQVTAPRLVDTMSFPAVQLSRIRIAGRHAYVTTTMCHADPMGLTPLGPSSLDSGGCLWVFDISDPIHPQRIGSLESKEGFYDLNVSGSNAYLGTLTGITVVDVAVPSSPRVVTTVANSYYRFSAPMAVVGNTAYSSAGRTDLSDPEHPFMDNVVSGLLAYSAGIATAGGQLVVAHNGSSYANACTLETVRVNRCTP